MEKLDIEDMLERVNGSREVAEVLVCDRGQGEDQRAQLNTR